MSCVYSCRDGSGKRKGAFAKPSGTIGWGWKGEFHGQLPPMAPTSGTPSTHFLQLKYLLTV